MQYILTQQEYDALRARQHQHITLPRDELQQLCTKIANEMPVAWWDDIVAPWGCVLSSEGEHYCDRCPVQDICPSDDKDWSK